jgi:hypothetical protein
MTKERLIEILKEILQVENIEVKNYSLESLIEQLSEDLNDRKNDND